MDFILVLGTVILSVITTIAMIIGLSNNIFDIKDRFSKWKENRKKSKFKKTFIDDNPYFKFRIGHISNTPPGICKLTVEFLNLSKKVKFIEPLSYNYEFRHLKNQYEPPNMVVDYQEWPKRLEHGQRFVISVDFHHMLNNGIFRYWKKGVQVYATCRSTTGDLLRSNSIDFDVLVEHLNPLNDNYKKLALSLSEKYNSSLRNIEVSLWQLQIFGRVTSHIVKQLENGGIPILQYLVQDLGLALVEGDTLYQMYKDLEQKKISPIIIEKYLLRLVQS